jgi:hypothetical protein
MAEVEARERKLQARAARLEAQEAALRANTLKSEAARSQQEQAVEAQAQMEARAEERAMVEVKARERQLQDLSAALEARKAAFQAEILKAEAIQARHDQALALGALAQTEAGVENRGKDEAKARDGGACRKSASPGGRTPGRDLEVGGDSAAKKRGVANGGVRWGAGHGRGQGARAQSAGWLLHANSFRGTGGGGWLGRPMRVRLLCQGRMSWRMETTTTESRQQSPSQVRPRSAKGLRREPTRRVTSEGADFCTEGTCS